MGQDIRVKVSAGTPKCWSLPGIEDCLKDLQGGLSKHSIFLSHLSRELILAPTRWNILGKSVKLYINTYFSLCPFWKKLLLTVVGKTPYLFHHISLSNILSLMKEQVETTSRFLSQRLQALPPPQGIINTRSKGLFGLIQVIKFPFVKSRFD